MDPPVETWRQRESEIFLKEDISGSEDSQLGDEAEAGKGNV